MNTAGAATLQLSPRSRNLVRDDCRAILAKTGIPAPALYRLYRAIDDYAR